MVESKVTPRLIITALRKLWWVAFLGAFIGGGVAYGYAAIQTPLYRATTSLIFAMSTGSSATDLNQGSAFTQSQMFSFAQLVPSSSVLEPVIEKLGLDTTPRDLARSVEVSIPQGTVTLRITAISAEPTRAATLANAIANQLMVVVQDVSPKTADGTGSTISAQVFDRAVPPEYQFTPNKPRDAILGAAVGGLAGIAAALLIGILDTRVRNEEQLTQAGGVAVLGVVSRAPLLASPGVGVLREPLGHTAEEFRRIQSALTFANVSSRVRVLLVTSSAPGEGKSVTTVNLAMTLAEVGNSVVLIDADLRRPTIHDHVGVDGSVGLTNVLLGEIDFELAKKNVAGTSFDALPAGDIPPNPAELLTSDRMEELIGTLSKHYDFVVIDTPPILSVADANLLAPIVDGGVIVVDSSKTRRAAVAKTVKELQAGGVRVLGAVLNRVRRDRRQSEYYSR